MTVTSHVLQTVLTTHVTGKAACVHVTGILQVQHVRNAPRVSQELTVTNLVQQAAKEVAAGTLVTVLTV